MPETLSPISRIAGTRGGVLTRRAAYAAGCSAREIDALIDRGELRALWRGILTAAPASTTAEGRHRELAHAIAVIYGGRLTVSHHSALVLAGLPVYGVDLSLVRFTRANKGDSLLSPPVHISRTSVPLGTRVVDGVRVVDEATAIAQVAAESGIEAAVVAGDAALHRGSVTTPELFTAAGLLPRGAHLGRARKAAELTDARSESPGESLLRLIAVRARIALESQYVVTDGRGGFVARCDFRIPGTKVLVEFDGKVKYDGPEALYAEKRREDALRALGWRMIRVVWPDLMAPSALIERLREGAGCHERARLSREAL